MSRWVIAIDNWHPARLNQWDGRHWTVRSRIKKGDRELVAHYATQSKVVSATSRRRVSLRLTLGPGQRGADPDAYWKSVLDALVHCGALRDDSRVWVELGDVVYERGPLRSTTIILEDVTGRV